MLPIDHVPHGDYRKLYQLRWFIIILNMSQQSCDEETDTIFHQQGVASSSRENAGGHVSEAVENDMHVNNVQSMGSGMRSQSSVYYTLSLIPAMYVSPIESFRTHRESESQVLQ